MPPRKKTTTTSTNTLSKHYTSTKKNLDASSKKAPVKAAPIKPIKEFEYSELLEKSIAQMGKATHGDMDPIEIIVRVWDCSDQYGPSANLDRLERFERAQKLGLNPPSEIGEILRKGPKELRSPVFQ